jgi:hypothetical protein
MNNVTDINTAGAHNTGYQLNERLKIDGTDSKNPIAYTSKNELIIDFTFLVRKIFDRNVILLFGVFRIFDVNTIN